jgi:two-component sensor histidine kinase
MTILIDTAYAHEVPCNLADLSQGLFVFDDTAPNRDDAAILFSRIAADNLTHLTQRQTDVLDLLLAGHASKSIAHELKISQRTVENHRAALAKRMDARSLPELIHSAVCGRCSTGGHDLSKGVDGKVVPLGLTAEEFIRLDMREVSHRLKNFAAVIQSICHQTERQAHGPADFTTIFSARLASYCRSLDALVAGEWSNIGMVELATLQLEPFGLLDSHQISLSGPTLKLMPATAHAVGMALHELATNAVKYGALSVPAGHVSVDWRIEGMNGLQEFVLSWREADGPAVVQPVRSGFGVQIIQRLTALALEGTVKHEFLPGGVEWELRLSAKALAKKAAPSQLGRVLALA